MQYLRLLSLASLATVTSAHWKRVPTSTASDTTLLESDSDASRLASSDNYTRCASSPTSEQRTLLDNLDTSQYDSIERTDYTVELYIHVVTTAAKRSGYSNTMIQNQVTVMNDAYASTGFTFELVGFDITVSETWASAAAGSTEETAMKTALRKGSYSDLNLYFLSDLADGLLGFCYFPTSNPSAAMQILDGCIQLADSMPGGDATDYNLGMTAVHEVGHWFGLYHPFEGLNCADAKGDKVGDTPRQSTPSYGCPTTKDSCPGIKGLDNFHNYMDYSYDSCLYEFTSGQAKRMRMLFDWRDSSY